MKHIIPYIITLFCVFSVQAQTYSSRKLAEVGEYIPPRCLPAKDSVFDCPKIIGGKSLVVKYNDKNEVVHLGVSLFSREMKEMINLPVCNFIERFLLELTQQKTASDVSKKLDEYRVTLEEKTLTGNSNLSPAALQSVLNRMKPSAHFALRQTGDNYTALWKLSDYEAVIMSFPVSRELIFGTNKKESDETLSELLPTNCCSEAQKQAIRFRADEMKANPYNARIFERKGNIFTLPQLNSDICCFRNDRGEFSPVYDADYPAVSLKNLFLLPQMNTSLQLHIKHRQYGNFTPEFEMNLSDFICFFQTESDIYCHVENAEREALKVTLIIHNKNFGYIHLLSVTTAAAAVFRDNEILQAEFYSNIPQHNIKNLFATN